MPTHQVLLFVHIPKSGGRSLEGVLMRPYRKSQIFIYGDRVEAYTGFFELPLETRRRIRLLKGHMPYGLHKAIPNPVSYVTMLRDPVERVISLYYYLFDYPDPTNYLYEKVVVPKLSLKEFVQNKITVEVDNFQTRQLVGGDDFYQLGFGECSEATLAQALHNLQHEFTMFGLTERFDESLLLMKKRLGWRLPPVYVTKNVTKNKPTRNAIDPEAIALIRECNQFDLELYRQATLFFDEALTRDDITPRAVENFRRLNRFYNQRFIPIRKRFRSYRKRLMRRLGR